MSFLSLMRAEVRRLQVSPVSMAAFILTLLIGAGVAATIVGYASPYEDNWLRDQEQSARENPQDYAASQGYLEYSYEEYSLDEPGNAKESLMSDGEPVWEFEPGVMTTSADGQVQTFSFDGIQVTCANEDCSTIFSEHPYSLDDLSSDGSQGVTLFLCVLVVGFSLLLVGSDASSGALATQLTFTPSRGRVMAAKSLVASAGGMSLMLLGHVVCQSILLVGFIAQRSYQEVGPWPSLVPDAARTILLAGILALAAAFVVFLGGDARLGAALAVAVVITSWFTVPWGLPYGEFHASPYLSLINPLVAVSAFIEPPAEIYYRPPGATVESQFLVSLPMAFGIAVAWLVLLGVLGYLSFSRRDIKN
ncbi:ABC transporter permease subunit [Tessaracoccus caeni]|uniref:ABC transporter permease subunit n=1 Tax=Tessaracoccus caeni TaxID=3031239 RepID=UPI0023D9D7C4|nr:ABC transporter permease subunit [Tessaracoccus caeni]MDF1489273.1 ABC transporter permease subunit [Tessaracoccus caeni]